jgi:hypothetical protein
MDMILVDWTRMGRSYCLAGAVADGGTYRIVRPLPVKFRAAPVRNVGWSAYLLDGHQRWEVFELIGPVPTPAEPPHVEDLWVRSLRPCQRLASPAERRAILTATLADPAEPLFGAPWEPTRAVGLRAGMGTRSLVTAVVAGTTLAFTGSHRRGPDPDIRVLLSLSGLGERSLPVKDHHLLARAEAAAPALETRLTVLTQLVQALGEPAAVRLGLSRPFQTAGDQLSLCWLMADGFFSLNDPQS